jgi:uncharacterized protein (UPF0548 family)
MALWRFGRGWPEATLRRHLGDLARRPVNFTTSPDEMTAANGWTVDGDDVVIGLEPPGPPLPDGLFARARQALISYDFSDPRIAVGHYDPRAAFVGRDMLLEIKVLGFHYLNGVRVHSVRDESDDHRTTFGFRYDTLEGHIEQGFEWFVLTQNHETGQVRFRIEAHWRLGQFPNWWSRLGFLVIGARCRELWRRSAARRLRRLAHRPAAAPPPASGHLAHPGDAAPRRTTSRQ